MGVDKGEYGGVDDEMTMLVTKRVMRKTKTFATCCRILQGLTVLRQVDDDLRRE